MNQLATSRPRYLDRAHEAVADHLAAAVPLPTFLAGVGALSKADRLLVLDQALVLMRDNYVHLPLKQAMHGVDPVQKLRLLRHRTEQTDAGDLEPQPAFHRAVLEVFNSVRDLHTNYFLPHPFAGRVAFLPFIVEDYVDLGRRRFIAGHVVPGFGHAHFRKGVEITRWNGVPIERAVEMVADRHAGSNLAARHVRGLDGLTLRPLLRALPPDADWVVIGYRDDAGVEREMRQTWMVVDVFPDRGEDDDDLQAAAAQAVDLEADHVRRAKAMLFAPRVIADRAAPAKLTTRPASEGSAVPTTMPGVFRAKSLATPSGTFAYLRIYTFSIGDETPTSFVEEAIRLLSLLPQNGLILDVRGNGGGHIYASEGLLQLFTPNDVTPEPVQFINTPLNLAICERFDGFADLDLGPWVPSMARALKTGAVYSRAFPITPTAFANRWGQHYHGPVVLVTDARCYSATDIFAAGVQDHDIGPVLGVDANTGAGGANVWTHSLLSLLLSDEPGLPPTQASSPYRPLPNGAAMRVSIRRTLRVGERTGTPVEDLGIVPDERHTLTRDDLLHHNRDLTASAGALLAARTAYRLDLDMGPVSAGLRIRIDTAELARIDVYVDGRPVQSLEVTDGRHAFTVPTPAPGTPVLVRGFDAAGRLVAARRATA